jgi:uncharacterized membrane protein
MNPEHRYQRQLGAGLLAYCLLVPLSIGLLGQVDGGILRVIIALLPVLPIPYMILAFLRYLRSLDELQQRIQLEAFGFSLSVTALITFTLGFLENAGVPQPSMTWVLPMMVAFWGIGQVVAARRYR